MDKELSYLDAIDMMEELRVTMKRVNKKNDPPHRKPEFQAMLYLVNKEKITMQELGEELCVTKPRVTALVNELLSKGFVSQSTDEKDKRKKFLQLSKEGIEYLELHRKNYEEWFKSIWDRFNNKEKEAFDILITRVNKILKEEIHKEDEN